MNIEITFLQRQGASHIKKNIVCQDFAKAIKDHNGNIILALSDGHGSAKYFRSDRGSRIAVEIAEEVLSEFIAHYKPETITPLINGNLLMQGTTKGDYSIQSFDADKIFRHLGGAILYRWQRKVVQDWMENPPSPAEMIRLSQEEKDLYSSVDRKRIVKAYGCTLQAAIRTKDFWFALHIGDGKVVAVRSDGTIYEPIPWDKDCFGTTTTSMCEVDPERIRYCYGINNSDASALFLASDGMDDSFTNFEELASFYGVNILENIHTNGWNNFINSIPKLLDIVSAKYSGDDMSLACWVTCEDIPSMMPTILNADKQRIVTQLEYFKGQLEVVKREKDEFVIQRRRLQDRVLGMQDGRNALEKIKDIFILLKEDVKMILKPISNTFGKAEEELNNESLDIEKNIIRLGVEIKAKENEIDKFAIRILSLEKELNTILNKLSQLSSLDVSADDIFDANSLHN